jgi:hypothetical protein
MIQKILLASAASVAMALSAPAVGKPGGGNSGANANVNAGANARVNAGAPSQSAIDARVNSQGAANASPNGIANAHPNSALHTQPMTSPTTNATNGKGLMNASPNAVAKANANSALARSAVPATALPGLTTGLTVKNADGTAIGTVSQVVTASDGSIRLVIVTSPTGETLRLAPNMLSISGGVVTMTNG